MAKMFGPGFDSLRLHLQGTFNESSLFIYRDKKVLYRPFIFGNEFRFINLFLHSGKCLLLNFHQMQLIECVPNFSEGRDLNIINQITAEIKAVEGVKLLNTDAGKATNRTVVTFVGSPEAVVEAAFRAIKKAGELIDMSKHKGAHPRIGATDVCPTACQKG